MGKANSGSVRTVRIFLASPSADTLEARARVVQVVNEIGADPQYAPHVRLDLLRWDDRAKPVVCDRAGNPQQDIVQQVGSPGDCDLVIGIFAHTMGGTLPAERFAPPSGRAAWHCSEWEVEQGLLASRAVWVFQDQRQPFDTSINALERWLAVKHYIDRLNPPGAPMREGFNPFTDLEDLAGKLRHGLRQWLSSRYIRGGRPGADSAPADLHAYLSRRSEHWRTSAAGCLDRRFVNLTLMIDHGLTHNGPRHEAQGRYDRLSALLAERPDVGAWVLVGDPGSGKSTILQHHELTTAAAALASEADAPPEVCVWQRLSEYSHDSAPPAEWLAARWPRDLPVLSALPGVARVRFLLDGLNEIKAPDRARQLEAIDRWTAWAAQQAHQADHVLAPIFSVRTLDQSPLGAGDFEVRQIVVARWSRDQVRDYCAHTLGEGNALWPRIEADRHLLELSELPFNLWAQCELFSALGRAASDRAELMGGLFWQMLVRRVHDGPLKVAGLLGDEDRQLIANGKWKEKLRALPDQQGCLVPWLDETMQRLHRLGRQVSVSREELLGGLAARAEWATPAQWLYAVRSLQLIGEGGSDEYSTDPLLRCTHQLWQEFFAARGLRFLPGQGADRLPDLRPPALAPLDEVLGKLGVQEPLPGPDPSHWEEPVKLAVQLVRDPLAWVRVLEAVNLPLAGRAAVACREKAERLHGAAVFDGLRQALLARSRDSAVDVRLRIEAGLVLGELGDPRFEERRGPHGRYLWPKQWVSIPSGTYALGRTDDASDEGAVLAVTLDFYEISWAPVTNAEFRCFCESDGYNPTALWWRGDAAQAWLAGIDGQIDGRRRQYLEMLELVRIDPEIMNDLPASFQEMLQRHLPMPQEHVHAELDRTRLPLPRDQPGFLRDPRFNQAAQPVVGISWFEAVAFAHWLSAQSGHSIRVPTEVEWEVAATANTHRPGWFNRETDPNCAQFNHIGSHLLRTSPVGVFPEGDTTPDSSGLTDVAGNVWEWTTSAVVEKCELDSAQVGAQDYTNLLVGRGGAWIGPPEHSLFRTKLYPGDRDNGLGVRLVRTEANSQSADIDGRQAAAEKLAGQAGASGPEGR